MLRKRYRRIVLFFARITVSLIVWELILPRVGFRRWAERTRSDRIRRIAATFRGLAVQMGGVLIKVGQFLSARVDVLPEEATTELAELQDMVPPEAFDDIRRVAEAELGAPLDERFATFEHVPLAAASLGQVHQATIYQTGDAPGPAAEGHDSVAHVVVKIQRPNIEAIVTTDLAALRTAGNWMRRYRPISRRVNVPALLAEFTRVVFEEIDYLAEGRNAEAFGASFSHRRGVRIPHVVWTHTTRRVLTLEDVYAIKITDYDAITAVGIDRAEVARRLFGTYLLQIFEDGFFHADPHPGNLFVTPGEADSAGWQLTFVDFGMAGRVPPNLRLGLRELLIATGTRDAARLVRSYQTLGILLPHADLKLLEQAQVKAFESFWGMSMAELRAIGHREMHEIAHEFRELVYEMPFQIPNDLLLLGRCVAILSGMCTGLDPQFNLWEGIAPYAQKLIADETSSGWQFWLGELGESARSLVTLPRRLESALSTVERGQLAVQTPQLTERAARLEWAVRKLGSAVVFAALLTSGVQLQVAGHSSWGWVLIGGAAASLGWMLLPRRDAR